MSVQNHPAYPQEQAHLQKTLSLIARETVLAREEERERRQALEDTRRRSGEGTALMLHELQYRMTSQALHNLQLAAKAPYFTRVDFTQSGETAPTAYYIGKAGVLDSLTQTPWVIDWRAPLANLYYAGQLGQVSYRAPDGEIEGELSLKRLMTIQDGQLQTIFDTDVVAQDAYLQNVLGESKDDRLKDIVSTIQREQNDIIRAPLRGPVVVQGAAGSGKTTIALHRIAYLLYAHRGELAPSQMLILAPSPLFLDYISAVLPELGVDQVHQWTFPQLCARLLGKDMPRLLTDDPLFTLLDPAAPQAQKQDLALAARLRGTLAFRDAIVRYLEQVERSLPPQEGFTLEGQTVLSGEALRQLYLQDLKPFPLKWRMEELKKPLRRRVSEMLGALIAAREERAAAMALLLRRTSPEDSPQRRAAMQRIYAQRDQAVAALREQIRAYPAQAAAALTPPRVMDAYIAFLSSPVPQGIDPQAWAALSRVALPALQAGRAAEEDLPALVLIRRKLYGLHEEMAIRHTVVDEAQDFSPFQFDLLRTLAGNSSFTLVGDLAQGIRAYRGTTAWREDLSAVFPDPAPTFLGLTTSYRSTVEIMRLAGKVCARRPYPGMVAAQPVLRHGEAPALEFVKPRALGGALAARVQGLLDEGYRTIAVIARDENECRPLHRGLQKALGQPVQRLTPKDTHYAGGVMVVSAPLAKGLEFDAVLIPDVSADRYPGSDLDARLLYVTMTRPLHRLYCYCTGELTPLLEAADFEAEG